MGPSGHRDGSDLDFFGSRLPGVLFMENMHCKNDDGDGIGECVMSKDLAAGLINKLLYQNGLTITA